MRRLLYIAYYFKKMDWHLLKRFLIYSSKVTKRKRLSLLLSSILDSFIYNISILEYFQFRFFEIDSKEKKNYAGTGFMYEYQHKMNPKNKRDILDDKIKFYAKYKKLIAHKVYNIQELKNEKYLLNELFSNETRKIVFKTSNGKCGAQVEIRRIKDFSANSTIDYMIDKKYDIIEEFVNQHPLLNNLSPAAVNTVRIFTQLDKNDKVEILGCRLRISVNSNVDNLAAGNLAAAIDEKIGIVIGDGVYSDITKKDESIHPITKIPIKGFKIPFWKETVKLAKDAALLYKQNRSVGWDIAITEDGPDLIEGNHDWCKLLWQLPVKEGLKPLLLKYLN